MKIIEKFTKPTMFDDQPYGTIVMVCDEEQEDCKFYIQISKEKDRPKWIISSEFFNIVFCKKIDNEQFMKECLDSFNSCT